MPTAAQFLAKPGAFPLKPVYAVVGDEAFLADRALEAIAATLTATHGEPETIRLTGDELETPAALFDLLRGGALFAPATFVIVVDHRSEKSNFVPRHNEALTAYCAKPARRGVVAFVLPGLRKNFRVAKAIDTHGLRIDCDPLKRPQIKAWLDKHARLDGARLDPGAAAELIETVGTDLARLQLELRKLVTYVGATGETITAEHVSRLAGYRGATDVWKLLDAVADGDVAVALARAQALVPEPKTMPLILGAIGSRVRGLWKARAALDAGADSRGAAKRANVFFNTDAFIAQARRLPVSRLDALHRALMRADMTSKSDQVPPDVLLQRLVLELCGAGRAPASRPR